MDGGHIKLHKLKSKSDSLGMNAFNDHNKLLLKKCQILELKRIIEIWLQTVTSFWDGRKYNSKEGLYIKKIIS